MPRLKPDWKSFSCITLILLLCIGLTTIHAEDPKVITVSNQEQFFAAIGSNRIIRLNPSTYNLTKVSPESSNPNLSWEKVFDGYELKIQDVENLTIEGVGPKPVQVYITPRYAWVFTFENARNIKLVNLEAGHSPEKGDCVGGVCAFLNCRNIEIKDSILYGCGTEGLLLSAVSGLVFSNSTIKECTYDIMTIRESEQIQFSGSDFLNNEGYFNMIEIKGSSDVRFEKCTISLNKAQSTGGLFYINDCKQVVFNGLHIEGNKTKYFIQGNIKPEMTGVKLVNNSFAMNDNVIFKAETQTTEVKQLPPNPFTSYENSDWEMEIADVKKMEKNKLIKKTAKTLIYRSHILGLDCTITYVFDKYNTLDAVIYQIRTKEPKSENPSFNDYKLLRSILIREYGKPFGDMGFPSIIPSDFWSIQPRDTELELFVADDDLNLIIANFMYVGRP